MKFNWKQNLPHIISILLMITFSCLYFLPQFQNKVLQTGDFVSYQGMTHELEQYRKDSKDDIMWTNSMFGGMPTHTLSLTRYNNVTSKIAQVFRFGIDRPAGMFLTGLICFYIMMVLLGVNSWISLAMSIVFAFSTSNLMLLGAGHMTKVNAIMFSPPIIAGVLLLFKERYLLGGFIFTLFMSLTTYANHPQMTYYLGIAIGIFMIFALVNAIKNGTLVQFAKSSVIMLFGLMIAIGTSANTLLPMYEYSKESMRGNPILEPTGNEVKSSSETVGLAWDYAMSWSGGPLDVISLFIPRAAGGGSIEEISKNSKFAKATGQKKGVRVPLYFGSLPSTAGPYYFGVVIFFLFILGAFVVRGQVKWWILTAVLVTIMMSMGKNIEWFNRLLFDYLPMFNKFRTPNSVLSTTGLLMSVMAGLAINKVLVTEDKSSLIRPVLYSIGLLGGFCLLFGIVAPSMINFENAYDTRMGLNESLLDIMYDERASMLRSSSFRSLMFVLLAGGAIWAYLKSYLSKSVLIGIIAVLALIDLVQISNRYFNKDSFVAKKSYESNNFKARAVDQQILTDKDPHFRVQDFSVDTYNDASTSYFHKTIGGYSPAKLQRIEDILDMHLRPRSQENPLGNQRVLNMLNAKYFILPGQNQTAQVQLNPSANGNAWFVNEIKIVNSANEEIDALADFEPLRTAIIHKEFSEYLKGFTPSNTGTIKLDSYKPHILTYTSETTEESLALFSEVWYGPNLGWQAYIDDKPVDHIRANYILRALKIPAGKHNIRFEFKPQIKKTGEMISLISSILLVGLGLFAAYSGYKFLKEN